MYLLKYTYSSLILFIFFGQLYSQNPISIKDSLDIIKVMDFQEKAWNNGDIDSFMNGYLMSEELVFSGSNGPIYGWNATKERYKRSYPDLKTMGKLSFTVRKISFGEGVERTFALYSPIVDSIKVIRSGQVRRAKLYYLRDRTGKSARIAEKIKKKIGIDLEVKSEQANEENLVQTVDQKKEEKEVKKESIEKKDPLKAETKKKVDKKETPKEKK